MLGMQFVSGLGDTVNRILQSAAPILIKRMDPTVKLADGVNIYNSFEHGGKGSNENTREGQPQEDTTARGEMQQKLNMLPEDHDDPAYQNLQAAPDAARTLLSILTSGMDGSVDWKSVGSTSDDASSGLSYSLSMLEFAKKFFKPSSKPPSVTLSKALDTLIRVSFSSLDKCARSLHNRLQKKSSRKLPKSRKWAWRNP